MTVDRHNEEIRKNWERWNNKPLLKQAYEAFYKLIAQYLSNLPDGHVVELGSGIGSIKTVIPKCIRTDLFPNPRIDKVENAYRLSFSDESISDLILFDTFHHLRYPGSALKEFQRVLMPKGRIIIFEPCLSLLGLIVFGLLHHETLGLKAAITWFAPPGWKPDDIDYYTAQGNASKIFLTSAYKNRLFHWNILEKRRLSGISYVALGGYSKPQLYPDAAFPMMRILDKICDRMPVLFATRVLVVLEKNSDKGALGC
jgi:hypothetical protein